MQLGNWVTHQYEPLMKSVIVTDNLNDLHKYTRLGDVETFMGWEEFLIHMDKDNTDPVPFNNIKDSRGSMHSDLIYSLFHFPAFHILTCFLYISLIYSFYIYSRNLSLGNPTEDGYTTQRITFGAVFSSICLTISYLHKIISGKMVNLMGEKKTCFTSKIRPEIEAGISWNKDYQRRRTTCLS